MQDPLEARFVEMTVAAQVRLCTRGAKGRLLLSCTLLEVAGSVPCGLGACVPSCLLRLCSFWSFLCLVLRGTDLLVLIAVLLLGPAYLHPRRG